MNKARMTGSMTRFRSLNFSILRKTRSFSSFPITLIYDTVQPQAPNLSAAPSPINVILHNCFLHRDPSDQSLCFSSPKSLADQKFEHRV